MVQHKSTNGSLSVITYQPGDGVPSVELPIDYANRMVWATQKQIAKVFHLDVSVVNRHIQNFKEQRGDKAKSSIAKFAIVTEDGATREVEHYDMTVITYIGFRAQATEITIAFQDWAGEQLDAAVTRRQDNHNLSPLEQLHLLVDALDEQQARLEDHEQRIGSLESQTRRIVAENEDLSDQVDYWHDQADINFGTDQSD